MNSCCDKSTEQWVTVAKTSHWFKIKITGVTKNLKNREHLEYGTQGDNIKMVLWKISCVTTDYEWKHTILRTYFWEPPPPSPPPPSSPPPYYFLIFSSSSSSSSPSATDYIRSLLATVMRKRRRVFGSAEFTIFFTTMILFIFNVFVCVPERDVNYNLFIRICKKKSPWLYTHFLKIRQLVLTYSIFFIKIIRIIFYVLYPRGWANVSFFLQICKISHDSYSYAYVSLRLICRGDCDLKF